MPNPLENFFPTEVRQNGIFIKVSREAQSKINLDRVKSALDNAYVMNYDLEKITQAVKKARNAPEFIGPPFEYFNQLINNYIEVQTFPLQALISVSVNSIEDGVYISASDIHYVLRRNGVVFGILTEEINRLIDEKDFGKQILVAKGTEPVQGQDAKVEMEVEIDPDARPKETKTGKVDFRDIQSFTQISKDQIIAKKFPPTKGKPGRSVKDEPIEPEPGKDKSLPRGKNTYVTEDGLKLMAEKTGVVYEYNDSINVAEILTVPGDVDFKVGNVKYSGNVVINGNVLPGFKVESEGDVYIKGEVQSAEIISRNGSVTIEKGVIGKNETKIFGKTGVTLSFVQEADIGTSGILEIHGQCLHCACTCEKFLSTNQNSVFVGGVLNASGSVEIMQISNEKEVPTKINIFDKMKKELEGKLSQLQQLEKQITEKLKPIKKQVQTKAAIMKSSGQAPTQRQKEEIKTWVDTYNNMNTKLKYVQKNISSIAEKLENPAERKGYVRVLKCAYPGTKMNFYGRTRTLEHKLERKLFRIVSEEIKEVEDTANKDDKKENTNEENNEK
ncbi:MAG: DUF342 domain-containing protein [Fibrobacterota bacterium]